MVSSIDASEHASKKVQEKGTAALFNATAPFLDGRRGNCVKNLLPGTEPQGFAGSGEQTAPRKNRPAPGGSAEIV